MQPEYASLLRQVETLSSPPYLDASEFLDSNDRRELRSRLRKLIVALEDFGDIVDRIVYAV